MNDEHESVPDMESPSSPYRGKQGRAYSRHDRYDTVFTAFFARCPCRDRSTFSSEQTRSLPGQRQNLSNLNTRLHAWCGGTQRGNARHFGKEESSGHGWRGLDGLERLAISR